MKLFIGALLVIVSVLLGYTASGGHLKVLWQPFEFVIIIGAAAGAFVIGNPTAVLSAMVPNLKRAVSGVTYSKKDYLELLVLLFTIIKAVKNKGMLFLDPHIDKPQESAMFKKFPKFLKDEKAVNFLCDYLRLLSMGSENAHQMEAIMDEELESLEQESHLIVSAFNNMSDGMPALGIVAAVLGVIHTMGSISQPPEVLGKLIGGALVGTFLGVLLSYGFVGPIGNFIKTLHEAERSYLGCLKTGINSYLGGYPPLIAVEYARKTIEPYKRPTFAELEKAVSDIKDI